MPDWNDVLKEIQTTIALHQGQARLQNQAAQAAVDTIRRKLPPEAVELRHLPDIHHGSVLEGIIAVQHTDRPGARITAGLLLAKVYRESDDSYLGGFACEYSGTGTVEEAHANLQEAMNGLFARRYSPKLQRLEFGKSVARTFTPKKSFGTVLVGIGFSSYLSPVLRSEVDFIPSYKDKSHVKYKTR